MKNLWSFQNLLKTNQLNNKWIELKKIRDICNISIEAKRATKEIGSSLEANILINLNDKMIDSFKDIDFSELCITSSAIVEKSSSSEITVITNKAEGEKCTVCWKINKNGCERHPN